jgi:hypothetical protein
MEMPRNHYSDRVGPGANDELDDGTETDGAPPDPDPDAGAEYDGPWDDYEAPVPIEIDPGDVVENARRRYGSGGAALAAGMFGLDVALNGERKKPESVQVQEAASEPIDVDKSGIQVMIDDLTSVESPPLERREPLSLKKKRSRRR